MRHADIFPAGVSSLTRIISAVMGPLSQCLIQPGRRYMQLMQQEVSLGGIWCPLWGMPHQQLPDYAFSEVGPVLGRMVWHVQGYIDCPVGHVIQSLYLRYEAHV